MHCRKRDLWKVGIIVASMLFLLVLMMWVPASAVDAHQQSAFATPATEATATLQPMPTEDATVTALNKEKLAQEVQQLENQNQSGPLGWLQANASVLLSTLIVVVGALFGFWRWRVDRRDAQEKELEDRKAERERRDEEQKRWLEDRKAERERQAEERFQAVCVGLGSNEVDAKVGAAIMLRTFLHPGYEQFYNQTFDLAVVHLRLRKVNPNISAGVKTFFPEPPDSLSQALITVFKESFPLARGQAKQASPALDATGIQLDSTYLVAADLKYAWMPAASLRGVNLEVADLREANLHSAHLDGADLSGANLSGAWLTNADFSKANLSEVNFSGAKLRWTKFCEANLREANLSKARLREANFSGAILDGADLSEADLSEVHPEEALSLKNADLRRVTGLTEEQLVACKTKGAIADKYPTTSVSQPTVVSSPSLQSNDPPAPSAPSAQGSPLPSDPGGNSVVSPQQEAEP